MARRTAAKLEPTVGRDGASPHIRSVAVVGFVSLVAVMAVATKIVYDRRYVCTLRLATGGAGGEYNSFGETLKSVIEGHQNGIEKRPRMRIELVTETGGSRDNMDLLERGEVDLALAQNDTPAKALVRSIAILFPEVFHLYVRDDANIEGLAGLRGKRVATLPEGSGTCSFLERLLLHYRLVGGEDSAQLLSVPPDEAHRMFLDGQTDAVFHSIALGETAKEYIGRSLENGAVLLPIEQVAALRTLHPFLEPAIIPKGCYRGDPPIPERDIPTVAVRAVLLAHSRVPKGIVHQITRMLYEHRNEIVTENPLAAEVRPPDTPNEGLFPLHAGAQAYYSREKPGFVVVYAEPLALCLSVAALCASGIWHLRLRLQQRQKNRADMYNLEILRLVERTRRAKDLCELDEVRQQLFDIFGRVLGDLDQDKISTGSFQFFAFPWGVAIGAIRHREWALMHQSSTGVFRPDSQGDTASSGTP